MKRTENVNFCTAAVVTANILAGDGAIKMTVPTDHNARLLPAWPYATRRPDKIQSIIFN